MKTKLTPEQQAELTKTLSEVWRNDQKMIDHCLKSSKYIYLDGRYIDCCEAKPTIHKTMWYDDETDGPDKNYTNFESYNMRNAPEEINTNDCRYDYYFQVQYTRDTTNKLFCVIAKSRWDEGTELTQVTDEQLKIINAAINEVREDYKTRLKNYWKKYSDKVYAMGYWTNR